MFHQTSDPGWGRQGTLIGCHRECEIMEQALARLASGRPQVVGLTGDPGIGKTRLLAEVARRAETAAAVIRGRLPAY